MVHYQVGLTGAVLRIPTNEYHRLGNCSTITAMASNYKTTFCPEDWKGDHDIDILVLLTRHFQTLLMNNTLQIRSVGFTVSNIEAVSPTTNSTVPVKLILKHDTIEEGKFYCNIIRHHSDRVTFPYFFKSTFNIITSW